jgi:hypothetical protein
MKRAPDPTFGSKPLKKSYPNLSYSKTLNSLIWALLKAVHRDETHNGLSVLEWAYKNVIGDGKTIPWGYFADELGLVSTLTERYTRALQDQGYMAEGTWPEICPLKKKEWVFYFFLNAIYTQVKREVDSIQFNLAVQVVKGQADALFSKYQLKYSATIAQCKLEEERLKSSKLQQLVALKEIEQAQKYTDDRMKSQQDL